MKATFKVLCISAFIFSFMTCSSLHAELRAAWEFDSADVSGSSVSATDGTAANTTGTLIADADASSGVLSVDGTGDYLQFGNNVTDLRALTAMTICVWVKCGASGTDQRRIVEHEDNIYFWQESGVYRFTLHGMSSTVGSTTGPQVGTWQHVAAVYQSGQPAKIYVNGVYEASSSTSFGDMANNTQTFQIAARRNSSGSPSNFYNGEMDDVAIWNEVLTDAQIAALAGKDVGGYLQRVTPTGLYDLIVSSKVPTAVGKTSVTMNGALVNEGGSSAEVRLYWGTSDGGTDISAWGNTNSFGIVSVGEVSTNLTGLTSGITYYYRYYATNSTADAWSDAGSFRTWQYLPDDLSDLQLWLKADEEVYSDSGSTLADSGDVVTQWNDFSGNDYHATRDGSVQNVTLINSSSGMPMVSFTDADSGDYLRSLGYSVADTNNLTVFIVAKSDPQTLNGTSIHPLIGSGSAGSGQGAFCISTMRPNVGGPGNLGYFGRNYNPWPYDEYTSNDATPNFSDGESHVIALTLSGADGNGTFSGYYDGEFTETHGGNTTDPLNGPIDIGGSIYTGSARYAGAFGDILIYDRVLTADERNQIGWYLQTKYSLSGTYRNPYGVFVTTLDARGITDDTAKLVCEVENKNLPGQVKVYWGTTDGGTDASAWSHTNDLGSISAGGIYSTNITGLAADATYYFRFCGSNAEGDSWSLETRSFNTWKYVPDQISDLQLWLKADDGVYQDAGSTGATNDSVVVQWNDFSGNTNTASRINSVGNLTYEDSGIGEMPMVTLTDLDGGDYLRVPSYTVADTDDLTVFVVSRSAPQTVNGSALHPLVSSGDPGSGRGAFCIMTARPNIGGSGNLGYSGHYYEAFPYQEYTSYDVEPNFGDGKTHVVTLTLSGVSGGGNGTLTGHYDGVLKEVHNGTKNDVLNYAVEIGGSYTGSNRRYAGAFGEILIYDRVLTENERNQVGWYLQEKYGAEGVYRDPQDLLITNTDATSVTQTSATFNGDLLDGELPADVIMYWGTVDGGTNAAAWAHTNDFGTVTALGSLSTNITGLTQGTRYYYRYYGTNSAGEVWTSGSVVFATTGTPVIDTLAVTTIDEDSATAIGELFSTGDASTTVKVYYGTTNGGTDTGSWDDSVDLGTQSAGALSAELSGLVAATTYYIRFYAENTHGGVWSDTFVSFTTSIDYNVNNDNLVLWLRADAGVTESGEVVESWLDQATVIGGANDAAGSGSSCPQLVSSAIGGKPAIMFDGADDLLTISDHDALDLGTGAGKGWTLVCVYHRTGGTTTGGEDQEIITKTLTGSIDTDYKIFLENNNLLWGTGISTDSGAWMSISEPSLNPHILLCTLDQTGTTSGNKTVNIDGTEAISGSYSEKAAANTAPVVIGSRSATFGAFQGYIAEVLIYNTELSDYRQQNIGWYLQEKYGISGSYEKPPQGMLIMLR